jgi:hypothetical protein
MVERPSQMRLRAFLQRLRHPYITRRGPLVMPTRAHTAIGATR